MFRMFIETKVKELCKTHLCKLVIEGTTSARNLVDNKPGKPELRDGVMANAHAQYARAENLVLEVVVGSKGLY